MLLESRGVVGESAKRRIVLRGCIDLAERQVWQPGLSSPGPNDGIATGTPALSPVQRLLRSTRQVAGFSKVAGNRTNVRSLSVCAMTAVIIS